MDDDFPPLQPTLQFSVRGISFRKILFKMNMYNVQERMLKKRRNFNTVECNGRMEKNQKFMQNRNSASNLVGHR